MVLGCFYPLCCWGTSWRQLLFLSSILCIFDNFCWTSWNSSHRQRLHESRLIIHLNKPVFQGEIRNSGLFLFFFFFSLYSSGRKSQQYKVPGLKFIIKAFPKFPFEIYFCGAFVKKSNKQFKFLFFMSNILNIYLYSVLISYGHI